MSLSMCIFDSFFNIVLPFSSSASTEAGAAAASSCVARALECTSDAGKDIDEMCDAFDDVMEVSCTAVTTSCAASLLIDSSPESDFLLTLLR